MAVAVTAMVAVAARMVVDGGVGGGGGDGGSLGGEGGGGEEAMAVDGEVVEEANGGGRWCAHTPCAPNTHCGVRGGYDRNHLHATPVVLRNTVVCTYPEGSRALRVWETSKCSSPSSILR